MRLRWSALLLMMLAVGSVRAQESERENGDREDEVDQQKRIEWFNQRRNAGPATDVEAAAKLGFEQFQKMPSLLLPSNGKFRTASLPAWQQTVGSQDNNVSGRTTGIGFDAKNPAVIYLGTPQGGLWKTTDKGLHWTSISSSWTKQVMGAVAVDPNNSNVVYAATGDADAQSLGSGIGILKSTDGGMNWTVVATPDVSNATHYSIIVDPKSALINGESSIIYASGNSGVVKSTDAGATWTRVLSSSAVTSLSMDMINTQNLIAGNTKIQRTTDGGKTWTSAKISSNRITVAIAPSNPSRVYASVNSGTGTVAISNDSGVTWTYTPTAPGQLGQQGWYANAISVNPYDDQDVITGGLDIYRSQNGGQSFYQATNWTANSSSTNFTHADIHVLAYNGSDLYALTDGGVYQSANGGTIWNQEMNRTLSTFQFVGVDAPANLSYIIGGAQDNGVNRARSYENTYHQTYGGDGGHTFVAQDNPSVVYSTYVNLDLRYSLDSGRTWANNAANILDNPNNTKMMNEGAPFYMEYTLCESYSQMVALVTNSGVWLSQNGGGTFDEISKIGGTKVPSPLTVNINDDALTIYASSSSTRSIYCSTDYGETWTRSSKAVGYASRIISDPKDPSQVFVSLSGYGGKHFAYSTDYGSTWSTPETNMPDISANTIARTKDGVIFIGNDAGVVCSVDDGVTWTPLRDGLPMVQIMTLQVRGTHLLAGTYGRGAFTLDISGFKKGQQISGVDQLAAVKSTELSVFPNPATATSTNTVTTTLEHSGNVKLAVYDELGREVRTVLNEYRPQGELRATVDLNGLAKGHYFYTLISNGISTMKSFVIE